MARERKMLVASIIFAVAGWLTVAGLATVLGAALEREVSAERDAAAWKRQAGKAYTELLKATAGTTNGALIIPAGARIECAVKEGEGKALIDCGESTIFPAMDY